MINAKHKKNATGVVTNSALWQMPIIEFATPDILEKQFSDKA